MLHFVLCIVQFRNKIGFCLLKVFELVTSDISASKHNVIHLLEVYIRFIVL